MAKHWKSFIEQEDTSKSGNPSANLPESLEQVAKLSKPLQELMEERERLEQELKSLSGATPSESSRYPNPEILSIDLKRKQDKLWDKKRTKIKSKMGIKNELPSLDDKRKHPQNGLSNPIGDFPFEELKKDYPKPQKNHPNKINKQRNQDSISTKPKKKNKITTKLNKGFELIPKSKNRIEKHENRIEERTKSTKKTIQSLDNALEQAQTFSKESGLEIEAIDKVKTLNSKVEKKLDSVENLLAKRAKKKTVFERQVKKVDDYMSTDLIKKVTTKQDKSKKNKGFSITPKDINMAIETISTLKKAKDNWMDQRDQNRGISKSKEGFKV